MDAVAVQMGAEANVLIRALQIAQIAVETHVTVSVAEDAIIIVLTVVITFVTHHVVQCVYLDVIGHVLLHAL